MKNIPKISNVILFTIFLLGLGANFVIANTSSGPRQTMYEYLKAMKEFKNGDKTGLKRAKSLLYLEHLHSETKENSGALAAKNLINTLDRIERVDVLKIPKKLDTDKWVYKKEILNTPDGQEELEISIQNYGGVKGWLFSQVTIEDISKFYDAVKNKEVVSGVKELKDWKAPLKKIMPNWMGNRAFILINGQWIGLFFIIFIGLILERFARFYLAAMVLRQLKKLSIHALSAKKEKQITFPFGMMALSGFFSVAIQVLELEDEALSICFKGARIGFTIATVFLAHHMVDVIALYFEKIAKESDNKFDDILVPLIKKSGKFFVLAVGVVAIGDSLSLDMKGILTGLGIGGLAFALAAKDTLGNVFGSLTVLLDRPFRIGDWVNIDGIEGTVEEVGLRSTRIRTFYDSLITVPNGTLTSVHVDNYGQRRYRRFKTNVGVQYDTKPELLEQFCEKIREIIKAHPHMRQDYYHVYFNSMGDFSLNIFVYVFFITPDWSEELKQRHKFLLDLLKCGNEIGINFAFPTQTLHVFDEFKKQQEAPQV
jgi:MscS family membrane protein